MGDRRVDSPVMTCWRTDVLVAAGALLGCQPPTSSATQPMPHSGGDSGDLVCHDFLDGPVLARQFALTCDEATSTVVFEVETVGWSDRSFLYVVGDDGAGAWSEQTTLWGYQWGKCGAWMRLDHALTTGVPRVEQEPEVSSVFTCDDYASGALTFALGVHDYGGLLDDCFVWGRDPAALVEEERHWGSPTFDLSSCSIGPPGLEGSAP